MFNDEKIPFIKPIKSINQIESKKRKLMVVEDDETDSHFEYKRKPLNCSFENRSLKLNDQELNEKDLWSITNEYDSLNDWKSLAKSLGLTGQDILLIENKHKHDLLECFYQCLLKWRLKQPENCNFNHLAKIINQKFNKTISKKSIQKSHNDYLKILLGDKSIDNVRLNEKSMWYASDFMCENWKSIGRYLGLKESSLSQIESKYLLTEGLRECCYQMFLLWSEQYCSDSYVDILCLKLIDMNFNFYVKEFLEYF